MFKKLFMLILLIVANSIYACDTGLIDLLGSGPLGKAVRKDMEVVFHSRKTVKEAAQKMSWCHLLDHMHTRIGALQDCASLYEKTARTFDDRNKLARCSRATLFYVQHRDRIPDFPDVSDDKELCVAYPDFTLVKVADEHGNWLPVRAPYGDHYLAAYVCKSHEDRANKEKLRLELEKIENRYYRLLSETKKLR